MATFTPGYNWTSGDLVTAARLNDLVRLAGMTRTSAVDTDDSTLEVSNNKYRIKDDGVKASHLNPDVAGNGLAQNATSGALEARVDDSTLEINADSLRVKDGGITQPKVDKATKAEMKSQSSSAGIVTPDVLINNPFIPKVYGRMLFNPSPTVSYTGLNIASITIPSQDHRQINLSVTMANNNYVVLGSIEDTPTHGASFVIKYGDTTTTSFVFNGSGLQEGANRYIHFAVFGNVA